MASDISNTTLDSDKLVYGEIYALYCNISKKYYIGQVVSHRRQRGKYKPFGTLGRWKDHVSEATSNTKRNQCTYLNNAIRLYKPESFTYECLLRCNKDQLDHYEEKFIISYNSFYPDGYNLTRGGKGKFLEQAVENNQPLNEKKKQGSWNIGKKYSEERKENMLAGMLKHISENPQRNIDISSAKEEFFNDKRTKLFSDVNMTDITLSDVDKHIRKKGKCYRLNINGVTTSFSITKHISQEEAYNKAINFFTYLVNGKNVKDL